MILKKHIAIYYTGGTIGMKATSSGLKPATNLNELINPILQEFADSINSEWFIHKPLIDSSAITLTDWQHWLQWLDNTSYKYDGFLILHGTDTMAYTANIIALARPNYNKPIIITGAQLPFATENSDAPLNLRTALAAFSLPNLHQTVIAFNGNLFPAIGSSKVSTEKPEGFANPHFGSLAQWSKTQGWHYAKQTNDNHLKESQQYLLNPETRIHSFTLTPGANLAMITASLNQNLPEGVIIQSYGNGNTPNDKDFINTIKNISKKSIPILNISQVQQGHCTAIYAQGHALREAGVINGGKCNLETALALLTIAVSNGWSKEKIENTLQQLTLTT